MLRYIDDKLDSYFDKNSSTYMDKSIWGDIFSYLSSIKEDKPVEYFYELQRCRDLKNSIDTAYEEGYIKGVALRAIKLGLDNEAISELTDLSIKEIEKLKNSVSKRKLN